LDEARITTERNIGSLRDEIVSLGPYAFDELTLDVAIEQCAPMWSRRYGLPIRLDLEDVNLSNETCGSLFGIAQEAVANAGRHSGGSNLTVSVTSVNGYVELRVRDDGSGFDQEAAMEWDEPGHIGLPTMRERAELVGGALIIDSGRDGTTVLARVPLGPSDEVED
jgi:signal transduction histidine kinase